MDPINQCLIELIKKCSRLYDMINKNSFDYEDKNNYITK